MSLESGIVGYLLTCSCHNQDKKAIEVFSLLFPDAPVPPVIKGRDRIYKLSQRTGSPHIKAISKLSGKYAYYIKMEGGKIVEEYNLITGKRVG